MNVTFLNEESFANYAILNALNSEILLQSITQEHEKSQDLEALYLHRLKLAIENHVIAKLRDDNFLNSNFDQNQLK